MGRWVKHYSDGTLYAGTDEAVGKGEASWRNSRQDSIVCVHLEHDDIRMYISGIGEYWQSDGYVSCLSGSHSLTHRRIMRQIEEEDLFFRIKKTQYTYAIDVATHLSNKGFKQIPIEWEGKWLVVEYDVQKESLDSFLKDDKY